MEKDPTGALNSALARGGWHSKELWIAVLGLGANLTVSAIDRIVAGTQAPTDREYTMLRIALYERFRDLGVTASVVSWSLLPDLADQHRRDLDRCRGLR